MNVTLINSYQGVLMNASAQMVKGVYGTVIANGVYCDNSWEVSGLDAVNFSGTYWRDFDGSSDADIKAAVKDCKPVTVSKQDDFMVYNLKIDTKYYDNNKVYLYRNPNIEGIDLAGASYGMLMHANGAELDVSGIPESIHGEFVNMDKMELHKHYDYAPIPDTYPSRVVVYDVTAEAYGAKGDGVADDTAAIKNALEQAGKDGGGIVFLPAGNYKLTGALEIGANVQLKGEWDALMPQSPTQIRVYYGKGTDSGSIITMKEKSMIHGLTFYFPEQKSGEENIVKYPWLIIGKGADITVEYLMLVNAYNGFNFFETRCDDLKIRGLWGTTIETGMKIGAGSKGGRIEYFFNSLGTWWEFSAREWGNDIFTYFGLYQTGVVLGDIKDFSFFSLTLFGQSTGMEFISEGAGGPTNCQFIRLMIDIPYGRRAITLEAGDKISISFLSMGILTAGKNLIRAEDSFNGSVLIYHQHLYGMAINRLNDKDIKIFEPGDGQKLTYFKHNLPHSKKTGARGCGNSSKAAVFGLAALAVMLAGVKRKAI